MSVNPSGNTILRSHSLSWSAAELIVNVPFGNINVTHVFFWNCVLMLLFTNEASNKSSVLTAVRFCLMKAISVSLITPVSLRLLIFA